MLWWDKNGETSLLWVLVPINGQHTRLITRVRMRYSLRLPDIFFNLLAGFTDIIMMCKYLLGIRRRAEALALQRTQSILPSHLEYLGCI
jgi:hypothetical protein